MEKCKDNETVIRKTLKDNNLIFETLFTAKPHVFIGKSSTLAGKRKITTEEFCRIRSNRLFLH